MTFAEFAEKHGLEVEVHRIGIGRLEVFISALGGARRAKFGVLCFEELGPAGALKLLAAAQDRRLKHFFSEAALKELLECEG